MGRLSYCTKCKSYNEIGTHMCKKCEEKEIKVEEEISNLIVEVWNKFTELTPTHYCDIDDFRNGIHELQKVLGMRELRRLMPKKYPAKYSKWEG